MGIWRRKKTPLPPPPRWGDGAFPGPGPGRDQLQGPRRRHPGSNQLSPAFNQLSTSFQPAFNQLSTSFYPDFTQLKIYLKLKDHSTGTEESNYQGQKRNKSKNHIFYFIKYWIRKGKKSSKIFVCKSKTHLRIPRKLYITFRDVAVLWYLYTADIQYFTISPRPSIVLFAILTNILELKHWTSLP